MFSEKQQECMHGTNADLYILASVQHTGSSKKVIHTVFTRGLGSFLFFNKLTAAPLNVHAETKSMNTPEIPDIAFQSWQGITIVYLLIHVWI